MNAEISETIRGRDLRFGMQVPELLTQRKFVSAMCHAYSNAHKPPITVNVIEKIRANHSKFVERKPKHQRDTRNRQRDLQ